VCAATGASATGPSAARSPAVAGAVHGFDAVEVIGNGEELLADALDVRGHRGIVDHHLRLAHQLVATLHVTGMPRQRVHDPELGDGQRHLLPIPADAHALQLDAQLAV